MNNIPVVQLFDFAVASLSVLHAWPFAILEVIKMPVGLRRAVERMYSDDSGYMMCE